MDRFRLIFLVHTALAVSSNDILDYTYPKKKENNRASLLFNMYASDNEHRVIRHPIFGHQRSSNDNKI